MNKKHLIDALLKVLSTRKESQDAVETIFSEIKKAVRGNDRVVISGFGSFQPYLAKPKKVRNPKTGEMLHISAKKKLRFRPAKDLL